MNLKNEILKIFKTLKFLMFCLIKISHYYKFYKIAKIYNFLLISKTNANGNFYARIGLVLEELSSSIILVVSGAEAEYDQY